MATAQHHDDQQTLKRALLDFVAETRHKDYETPEQTKELMQAMLATRVQDTPWQSVYAHIAPKNVDRLAHKTHNIDFADRPLNPLVYAALVTQSESTHSPEKYPTLHAFADALIPESAEPHIYAKSKQEMHKAMLLGLAIASGIDPRSVVDDIWPDPALAAPIHEKLLKRKTTRLLHANNTSDPALPRASRDIGRFIAHLKFPGIESGKLYLVDAAATPAPASASASTGAAAKQKPQLTTGLSIAAPYASLPEGAAEVSLAVRYRKANALSKELPTSTVYKQVLLAAIVSDFDSVAVRRRILDRYQRGLEPNPLKEEHREEFVALCTNLINQMSTRQILALMETPEIKEGLKRAVTADTAQVHIAKKLVELALPGGAPTAETKVPISQELVSAIDW